MRASMSVLVICGLLADAATAQPALTPPAPVGPPAPSSAAPPAAATSSTPDAAAQPAAALVADPWAPPPAVADPWTPPPTVITPVLEPANEPEPALRPVGWSVAIGVGYTFPTSLQTPNITSVRLRLANGLTVEPQLALAASAIRMPVGSNDRGELSVGSLVRYPLRARRRVDLEVIASAAVSYHSVDPAGDLNNRATTTFDLGYGVALAYWLTPHWSVSLTATNPLLSIDRTRQEAGATGASVNQSTTGGLVFDPQVAVMIHLYD